MFSTFSVLPDLTPRDSHTLWYTSSRSPVPPTAHADAAIAGLDPSVPPIASRRANQAALERTALARLRADEAYQERRRANISNFGATWLKPPGVAKSLFQMREERREAEEHAEALRREALAMQLAGAEEGDEGMLEGGGGEPMDEEGMGGGVGGGMVGGEGEEERNLDDEIPDADAEGFGFDGAESDPELGSELDDVTGVQATPTGAVAVGRAAQQQEIRHMRANEDRVREMMTRGQQGDGPSDMYVGDDIDEEDQAQMLEEDDLVHVPHHIAGEDLDLDMDADLDDDIAEAESGLYEHTDTEASMSSDDGGGPGPGFAPARGPRAPPVRNSLARSEGHSIDISSLLSRDGSSAMGSSPHGRRRP